MIETELALADLETVEKRLMGGKKKNKLDDASMKVLGQCKVLLEEGKWLADAPWTAEEMQTLHTLQLLTSKPMAYICNVDEAAAADGNDHTRAVEAALAAKPPSPYNKSLVLSGVLEEEASKEDSEEGRMELLDMAGA